MNSTQLINLAGKNEVRIDNHKGGSSKPPYFYHSLRNAIDYYFKTFRSNNSSYDFYISATSTNKKKTLSIIERQFLDEENTVLCIVSFERFFELFLKDLLKRVNVKLTQAEEKKGKSRTTWELAEKIRLKTFKPFNPGRGIHQVPFRETIRRFYNLIDLTKDTVKSKQPLVRKFSKVFSAFTFLDNSQHKSIFEFINWYRDRILHNGNKLPTLRLLDYMVTQRILPVVNMVLKSEKDIPNEWLFFTKTVSGIEILSEMEKLKFKVRNSKTRRQVSESYNMLLCLGHLKELGRANLNMNLDARANRSPYEYNYHDIKGRGIRFARSENRNHPHAVKVKHCPCCTEKSLVHYKILGKDLHIPKREDIEWLKCYTCDYYIRYNVLDLHYFNPQFEKHFSNY
jgi:hypothetical protein